MPFYSLQSSQSQSGIITQQISPTIVFSTGGNWINVPTSLSNAIDGDEATSTSMGLAGGFGGALGYIILDLSQEISWLHCVFKIGIQKENTTGVGNWGIDFSIDNSVWTTCWGYINKIGVSDSSELILSKNFTVKDTVRFIKFWCQDIGAYGCKLKIYDIKFYTLA